MDRDEEADGLQHPRAVYRPFYGSRFSDTTAASFRDPLPAAHDGAVYHYTNADGLHGVLTSNCVYASHAITMNDPREGSFGWDVIRERYEADPPPRGSEFSTIFDEIFSSDGNRSWETPAFVLSGTALPGNLNQYRLYGMYQVELDGGTWGLLPRDGTEPHSMTPRAQWRPVLYGAAGAEPYVDRMLDWAVQIMASVNPENFEDTGLVAALAIQVLALHIKDESYAHEDELRLVFGVERFGWQDWVEVRPRSDRLVPYVRATTGKVQDGVVRAVELGPTVQGRANVDAVKHLHNARFPLSSFAGFASDLPVTESAARYRDG